MTESKGAMGTIAAELHLLCSSASFYDISYHMLIVPSLAMQSPRSEENERKGNVHNVSEHSIPCWEEGRAE